MNKNRINTDGRITAGVILTMVALTAVMLLPNAYLPVEFIIAVAIFLMFLFSITMASVLTDGLDKIFVVIVTILVAVHMVAGASAIVGGTPPAKQPDPEALIQYASENGYSEILLENDKHPKFRAGEDDEFQEATNEVVHDAIIYRRTHNARLFERIQRLRLSDLGLDEPDNCETGLVNGKDIQVCQSDTIGSIVVSLDTNGDIESVVAE